MARNKSRVKDILAKNRRLEQDLETSRAELEEAAAERDVNEQKLRRINGEKIRNRHKSVAFNFGLWGERGYFNWAGQQFK